ncbi:MAG: BCCT family transporter [Desulfovibrionales bacterium]|nr:BCCT family transporter [Desulfovibrionales bacterium]
MSFEKVKSDLRPDWKILIPTALTVLGIAFLSITWPAEVGAIIKSIRNTFIAHTGAYWLWISFALLATMFFFIFTPYGNIKFGEEKPEFSTFSWFCMTFCTAVAGAVMYWGIVEPMDHLANPPFGAEPLSREAYRWALSFTLFREFYTWPWYLVTALPICYFYHNRKKYVLRISHAASDIIGEERAKGAVGSFFEILCATGLILTNAGVLAVSVPMIARAFALAVGMEHSMTLNMIVLAISTVVFATSTGLGLEKGIKRLSEINVFIAVALLAYGFIAGPSSFIMENLTYSIGNMVDNFFSIALWAEPYNAQGTVAQDWTIFSTIWMVTYAPVVGIFTAKISRGRTVREVLLVLFVGSTLGRFLIYGIYGGIMMGFQLDGTVDAIAIMNAQGYGPAMAAVMKGLPLGALVLLVYCLFTTIFTATSLDSSSFVIASSMSRSLSPDDEPTRAHRFFWAFAQAAVGVGLIVIGGLGTMKAFAIMAGALMIVPVLAVILGWFKMIKGENYLALKYHELFTKGSKEQIEAVLGSEKKAA